MTKTLILALCGALCLAGCATLPPPTGSAGPPPIVSTQGTLVDERALFAAEAAYNVAAHAYLTADDRGQLPAGVRATARDALIKSFDALEVARRAYAAGDAPTFAAQAAAVIALAADARRLIPR